MEVLITVDRKSFLSKAQVIAALCHVRVLSPVDFADEIQVCPGIAGVRRHSQQLEVRASYARRR